MRRSIALTVLALAAACKGKETPASDSTAAARPPAAPAPVTAVRIVTPIEGETTGADVTVVLAKEGVTIAKADGAKVEGIGHYHLFLDTPPSPDTLPIPPTSKTIVHLGTGDSTYTFKGVAPGAHEIIAVLAYGNHVPMPSRRDTVKFVVKP